LRAIRTTDASLVDIAAQFGFADQAHMTRSVKNLTARCPGAWRLACK
jgi:AraC-like DNA-binding protein